MLMAPLPLDWTGVEGGHVWPLLTDTTYLLLSLPQNLLVTLLGHDTWSSCLPLDVTI